jgi:predicted dehydrogenase
MRHALELGKPMKTETTRREFFQQTTHAAAVIAAASTLRGVHALGATTSKTLRLGLVGCGNIMRIHIRGLAAEQKDVAVAWLCDVDENQIDLAAKALGKLNSSKPRRTSNFEDVLADDQVDAVIIATPHQWHAPMALSAMRAGKDVYLEKPISHVFAEGTLLIAAAKESGRILQQGSQMRSSPVTQKAGQLLRDGIIGEVKVARAWSAEKKVAVKTVPDSSPPKSVDYDRWLGPAPARPFNANRFHKTWRLYLDYANGDIGDDGIHDLDMATWGLGVTTLPCKVTARGGTIFLKEHSSEFPDNMNVVYEYPDGRTILFENLPFTPYGIHGYDSGNVFYGTEGYMIFSRRGAFNVFLGPKGTQGPTEDAKHRGRRGYPEHMANFLCAVRERSPINAPPDIAHRSCALVHLGNATYQTTGHLAFDAESEQFIDCEAANLLLNKKYRNPFALKR